MNTTNQSLPHKKFTSNLPRHTLEKLGKKLASFTQKKADFQTFSESQKYQNLDITHFTQTFTPNKNAFHDHIPKLSKRLFGSTKYGELGTLAGKFVSPETLEKLSDKTFLQIGKLAQTWAEVDLYKDKRFANQTLNINERHALAQAIAYQNRGLVAVGSISNLVGLVGILGDTLWLLTVALRSIFQIASIYDKPLTGKAGIQIAYEILAQADLNKLQEKQTLLAGIGVVESIVDKNLASNSSRVQADSQYKKLTKFADEKESEQSSLLIKAMDYLKTGEKLAKRMNLNLHTAKFAKLNKVLPITAVGIGASYNNMIIDEVLTIAMATFAPKPKMANVKTLQNQETLKLNFDNA